MSVATSTVTASDRGRRSIVLLLIAGILVCLALLPWRTWLGGKPAYEQLLAERTARYIELRQKDEWTEVYKLLDERDRDRVPLVKFLMLYGRGMLKVHRIAEKQHQIDLPKGTATVTMVLDGELNIANLPPEQRNSLKKDTAPTRDSTEFAVDWVWREGNWWLRAEPTLLNGVDKSGRQITPVQGPPAPGGDGTARKDETPK